MIDVSVMYFLDRFLYVIDSSRHKKLSINDTHFQFTKSFDNKKFFDKKIITFLQ